MKFAGRAAVVAAAVGMSVAMWPANADTPESASGHGTLSGGTRQFSFNAKRQADGTVTGQAQLTSRTPGVPGEPYRLHLEITCMKRNGNVVFFGGNTKSTNDPNIVDAAYFSVQDNGEPGAGVDKISRVFFYDDDPTTVGDPQLCQGNVPGDFPQETIEAGNIQVRP